MTSIKDLLDTDTRQKLAGVTATVKADEPAFVVLKASTDPNPPRTLRPEDALDIDPRSGAMIDALCVDCKAPLLIDPALPEGVDEGMPRYPICAKDAKIRARFAAIAEQRNVEVIRRHTVAKHQPRTSDGIDHPVTITHKTQENDMDLDNLTDAELGAHVRLTMQQRKAETIPAKRKKAKKVQENAEAKAQAGIKQQQAERKGLVLAEFAVGTLIVPALDLSDVTNLNEMVSTTLRSPYNKARFRLAGEPPLWAPKDEDKDGYTPTTYQTLMDEHARLMALAADKAKAKAEPKPKKKAAAPVITALLDPDEEAQVKRKVKALVKATGIDKATARAIVLNG